MKKILVIPDVHGRLFWIDAIKNNQTDLIIFLGDYLDPYENYNGKEYDRFLDIIELKKKEPEKVILLLGNHDCHYLFDDFIRSSRFDYDNYKRNSKLYKENKDLFQFAYYENDRLFTHAGITEGWLKFNNLVLPKENIDEWLNNLDIKYYNQCGRSRGGRYPVGSPVWADLDDHYYGDLEIKQVIGHTFYPTHCIEDYNKDEIIQCIDCGRAHIIGEDNVIYEPPSKEREEYNAWIEEIKKRWN
jgi:3',5'-cyclic AMP phosphodiesterase CpdA